MKIVNLTITLDGPIPAVTKQDIAEQHIINRGHVDAAIEEN